MTIHFSHDEYGSTKPLPTSDWHDFLHGWFTYRSLKMNSFEHQMGRLWWVPSSVTLGITHEMILIPWKELEVLNSLAWCSLHHAMFELVPADWLGRSKSTRDCETSEFFASYAKQNWWDECIAGQRARSFKKGYWRSTSCHQGNPSFCWRYQKSRTSNGRDQ